MIGLLLTILIVGLILWIVWWAISQIPLPPPFALVARVVFALVYVILLIGILTGGLGELGSGWSGFHLGNWRGCP